MSVPNPVSIQLLDRRRDARAVVNEQASSELIFAVVGPVGSGTTWVADALARLAKSELNTVDIVPIKASSVIEKSIVDHSGTALQTKNRLERARALQDAGDQLRSHDPAAVASLLVSAVKRAREELQRSSDASSVTSLPGMEQRNGVTRVFVLDSLKHPAEVRLLRAVYREAFCLIGVVCETTVRKARLQNGKCQDSSSTDIDNFMKRDEDAKEEWGQHVADTFHLADFFVDNTPERFIEANVENKDWVVNEKLGRLLDILVGNKIVRPSPAETGMFHAAGAQLRSACLSRQVGAAITDDKGNLLATGTNEVPRSGGGVYGGQFDQDVGDEPDHRCAHTNKYCSNTKVQDEMMMEVIRSISELAPEVDEAKMKIALRATAMGRLLEFSRAVHAEMDALLTAARTAASTVGTKMFVTTFPCHYCARHLVAAGVEEVQYIEPYPKSKAFELHSDSIEQIFSKWKKDERARNSKVLFRPFTGVAPRLYGRAFLKNRKLKNRSGDLEISMPEWTAGLLETSYLELESKLEAKLDGQ